jgi:hypothetical protein
VRSVKRPETQRRFGPPEGWDQGRATCDDLWVEVNELAGLPLASSYWVPTPEELRILNDGGHVRLTVVGGQPPVALEIVPSPVDQPED